MLLAEKLLAKGLLAEKLLAKELEVFSPSL